MGALARRLLPAGARRRLLAAREAWRGRTEARGLRRALPLLRDTGEALGAAERRLAPAYRRYVAEVSIPIMAVSLELALFLDVLVRGTGPRRALDLGSGFSSYVLRLPGGPGEVWSADDAPEWLERTRGFLLREGLGAQNVVAWEALRRNPPEPFDLVLHDLGTMDTRRDAGGGDPPHAPGGDPRARRPPQARVRVLRAPAPALARRPPLQRAGLDARPGRALRAGRAAASAVKRK